MSDWPSTNDYTVAIQNPQTCFKDSSLRNCSTEVHHLTRMPKVWTGNFAQVYELKNSSMKWAVKCFTRSSSNVRQRYSVISNAITASKLPYFIDFHFLDNEILVGGKRYPIVKMEWVQGETLDKYIESNLYRSQTLLDLATRLISMVKSLEEKGLAHGDIQHGNVLIKNNELKLVDYDGLFVPEFKGTLAPEQGLPSYQHPLRNGQFYDSTLDRFLLLVICTSLSALAVDPSLWYEFSTGDNLLFTKQDFVEPNTSRLFNRLKSSADGQVKTLVELLRIASVKKATEVNFLDIEISSTSDRSTHWWLSTTPITTKPIQKIHKIPTSLTGIIAWFDNHKVFMTGVLTTLVFFFFYMFGSISIVNVTWVSIATIITYLIERYTFFTKLPVFNRRNELLKRLRELDIEIKQKISEQNNQQNEHAKLSQLEIQEKTIALKEYKERELINGLSKIDILKLSQVKGFGPYIIKNLHTAGIYNVADLRKKNWYSVRGIGQTKSRQIRDWLNQMEQYTIRNIPQRLPYDTENRITTKYIQQRQNMKNQLNIIAQRINALRSEQSQRQSEFAQLYLPSFGEYFKHNL